MLHLCRMNTNLLASALALTALASAQVDSFGSTALYASTGGANSSGGGLIYKIDPVTQTVTLVGDTGLSQTGGLAFDPSGDLYLSNGGSVGPASLYTIDPNNGSATLVGGLAGIQGVDALAFDAAGNLYGGGWSGSEGRLLGIDPSDTSVDSNIAMSGTGNSFVPGLAFDPSGVLYGSRGNSGGHTEDLVTIDLGTGALTAIGGTSHVISDIWFAADGTLYGGSPTGDLFEIDPGTGDKTFLFNTGVRISGLTGIEDNTAVPDAGATWALLGLAFTTLGLLRRKASR